ncbi:LysM peptidoglycan-binding domain-containing protein [Arthrobacter sp. 3Tela_A]|uniref:LysM peptidoglycan-binding domain-containing protein n=1 Tax=Arthrobacter sp. 3Tela_A TaxID=3093743 RepID=UPI003BB6CAE6
MAFRGTHRRRMLEDLFQAGAAMGAGALLLWASRLLQESTPGPFPPVSLRSLADLQSAAGLAAGWAGLLVLAWWGVGAVAALVSALLLRSGKCRASRAVGRFSPAFLRRLAAAALGVQLAAAPLPVLASPAGSTAPASTASYTVPVSGSPAADPGWNPSNSTGLGRAAAHSSEEAADPSWKPSPGPVDSSLLIPGVARGEPAAAATVTVRAGDTLWNLAAAQLGPLATDHEVARHWPAWHAANRFVIGPDPHHLLPGQVLTVPPPPAN